jgi:superfamily II RNA helicase
MIRRRRKSHLAAAAAPPRPSSALRLLVRMCRIFVLFVVLIFIPSCISSFSLLHLPTRGGRITTKTTTRFIIVATSASSSTPSTDETTFAPAPASSEDLSDLVRFAKQQGLDKYFVFPLDDWQLQAGGAILRGDNVIVCAPTGAGKTVVGEMALLHAFHDLKCKGIYTTPLKALSNQKYADLCRIFGRSNTGLSTGDVSVNRSARITVMTTEVYRNIAWRSSSSSSSPTNDSNSNSKDDLSKNAIVVLDEFHYMGYTGRGGVWEECVITSPSHTQIIGLSATLANGAALASWMESVTNRRTVLVDVPGQQRPVPLRYLFATREGLYPLFRDPDAGPGSPKGLLGYRNDGQADDAMGTKVGAADKKNSKKNKTRGFQKVPTKEEVQKLPTGLQVNPELRAAARRQLQRVDRAFERQKARRGLRLIDEDGSDFNSNSNDRFGRGRGGGGGSKRRDPTSNAVYQSPRKLSPREERREKERLMRNEMRRMVPSLSALLSRLRQKELLPAIFFIFSRARCDEAARTVCQTMMGPDPNRLLDDDEDDFDRPLSSSMASSTSTTFSKKRKTPRQRGRRDGGGFLVDNDGRTFRAQSNYHSENVVNSLFENDSTSPNVEDDGSFEYYTKAGLLNMKEVQEVMSRATRFNHDNPEIAFDDDIMEQYLFGVGSHHAGMLPAHKTFVEALYRDQLMKAVFATETLAAGINMPARTTVVCALAKRGDGSSMNLLQTSNLLQMAGRAGRRGFDTSGTCVIVATPFESHEDAAKILTDPLLPIRSQFKPS